MGADQGNNEQAPDAHCAHLGRSRAPSRAPTTPIRPRRTSETSQACSASRPRSSGLPMPPRRPRPWAARRGPFLSTPRTRACRCSLPSMRPRTRTSGRAPLTSRPSRRSSRCSTRSVKSDPIFASDPTAGLRAGRDGDLPRRRQLAALRPDRPAQHRRQGHVQQEADDGGDASGGHYGAHSSRGGAGLQRRKPVGLAPQATRRLIDPSM
jgi:hypothetical protein